MYPDNSSCSKRVMSEFRSRMFENRASYDCGESSKSVSLVLSCANRRNEAGDLQVFGECLGRGQVKEDAGLGNSAKKTNGALLMIRKYRQFGGERRTSIDAILSNNDAVPFI